VELRQLRTFEAVVREGTVTDAAVALNLAPSSVSAQIRALEQSLGVRLFARAPRGMRLTGPGLRMLTWAHSLLELADQARQDVTEQRPALRLGALETIAAMHGPTVLARLAERRPDLAVEVRPFTSRDRLLREVATGDLDAGLLLDTGSALGELGFTPPPDPLTFLDLDPVPLVVAAPPTHPMAGRRGLGPPDMAGQRLLVAPAGCSFRIAGERVFGAVPDRVQMDSMAVIRGWTAKGMGIALLPEFAVAAELIAGTLVRLDFAVPDLALRLVWRADRETLPGLREVLYAAAG
jgi:DNA-binding transcriptional LysR family regulator